MKVTSTPTPALSSLKSGALKGDATSASTGASTASAQSDSQAAESSVNLSGLSTLRGAAGSSSVDNTALIESIRQRLANGTLTFDSGKIADGVLETARGLLKNQRR